MADREGRWKRLTAEAVAIFLGVTAGFLADDYRDYLNDREREVELLTQLIEDLRLDSADITPILQPSLAREETMVWLNSELDRGAISADSLRARFTALADPLYITYEPAAFTYSALKATGDLNLIRDRALRDTIVYYFEDRQPVLDDINADSEDVEAQWWSELSDYVTYGVTSTPITYPPLTSVDAVGLISDSQFIFQSQQMRVWYAAQNQVAVQMLETNRSLQGAIAGYLERN